MKRRQYWRIAALVTATLGSVVADTEDYTRASPCLVEPCVFPTQSCPLCGDGSNNVTHEYSSQFGGVGCNTFVASANSVAGDSLECELLQLAAFQGECCETYYNDHQCTMCPPGNSIAYPPRHVPYPHPESDLTNVNCNDLQTNATVQLEFLLQDFGTPGVCNDTLLRRSAGWCGCEGVEEECVLCDNDGVVEPQQQETQHPLTGMSCSSDIAYQVALLSSDQCPDVALHLGFDATALCCLGGESPDRCPICSPTRQQLIEDKVIVTDLYGEVTCADIQDAATLIPTDGLCQTFRQEQVPLAYMCCEDLPPLEEGAACELLCEDGLPPPDIHRTDLVTRHSCDSLATDFTKLPQDQCHNAAFLLGFDAHAFCCSDPPPPPNICDPICPQGEQLLYPHRILYSYGEHTCAAVQDSLAFAVGDGCTKLLDESRVLRNCPCRRPSSTLDDDETNVDDAIDRGSSSSGRASLKRNAIFLLAFLFAISWR